MDEHRVDEMMRTIKVMIDEVELHDNLHLRKLEGGIVVGDINENTDKTEAEECEEYH